MLRDRSNKIYIRSAQGKPQNSDEIKELNKWKEHLSPQKKLNIVKKYFLKEWKILLIFSFKSLTPVVHQGKGVLKEVSLGVWPLV